MNNAKTFTGILLAILITAASLQAGPRSTGSGQAKPNIVHILTDDFGWQDPVCFDVDGETPFETPHLDRLAKHGRKFMQAYSPAPTCSPSRAAYISGQYPAHTGIYHVYGGKLPRAYYEGIARVTSHINPFYPYRLPLSEMTIPKELKKAGYTTGHVGKWHLAVAAMAIPSRETMDSTWAISKTWIGEGATIPIPTSGGNETIHALSITGWPLR